MAKLPRDLDIKVKIIGCLVNVIFKYPEERIGQILYNCIAKDLNFWEISDTFYMTDKNLLDCLNKRISPLE